MGGDISKTFKPFFSFIFIIGYLLICYVLLTLFVATGAKLFLSDISTSTLVFNRSSICLLLGLTLGSFIYLGLLSVSRINGLLISLALSLSFVFIVQKIQYIHFQNIISHHSFSILSIPFFFSAFSFQTVIPTLSTYLNGHIQSLRLTIIIGPTIALLAYILWSIGLGQGDFLNQPIWNGVSRFLIFLILIGSFLGISTGLFDFLAEGLKEPKRGWHKLMLTLLICIPAVISAILFSNFFYKLFGTIIVPYVAPILYGIMPVLLIYNRRSNIAVQRQDVFKRKWDLIAMLLWTCFIVVIALMN